jgi:hypothetical protein
MAFKRPTTTPTPDEIFDEWVHKLKHAELLALLYIVRRTCGFRDRYGEIKDGDTISLRQFHEGIVTRTGKRLDHGCGVRSKTSLTAALKRLEELGLIRVRRAESPEKGNETTWFALAFVGDDAGSNVPPESPAPPHDMDETRSGTSDEEPSVAPNREAVQGECASSLPPVRGSYRGGYADRTGGGTRIVPGGVRKTDPQQTDETTNRTKQQTAISKRDEHSGRGSRPIDSTDSTVLTKNRSLIETPERDALSVATAVAHLAVEFGDDAPQASRTRVTNMWRASELDDTALLALLDEAAAITRSQAAAITKRGRGGAVIRMPYLLATLRGLVDATTDATPASAPVSRVSVMPSPVVPFVPDLDDPPATTEAEALWRDVRGEVRRDVTPENYATWFVPAQALALDEGVLHVGVPTPFHGQWLEHKLHGCVERALGRMGHGGVRVAYTVIAPGEGAARDDQAESHALALAPLGDHGVALAPPAAAPAVFPPAALSPVAPAARAPLPPGGPGAARDHCACPCGTGRRSLTADAAHDGDAGTTGVGLYPILEVAGRGATTMARGEGER